MKDSQVLADNYPIETLGAALRLAKAREEFADQPDLDRIDKLQDIADLAKPTPKRTDEETLRIVVCTAEHADDNIEDIVELWAALRSIRDLCREQLGQ